MNNSLNPRLSDTLIDQACERLREQGLARVEVRQVRAGVEVALAHCEAQAAALGYVQDLAAEIRKPKEQPGV